MKPNPSRLRLPNPPSLSRYRPTHRRCRQRRADVANVKPPTLQPFGPMNIGSWLRSCRAAAFSLQPLAFSLSDANPIFPCSTSGPFYPFQILNYPLQILEYPLQILEYPLQILEYPLQIPPRFLPGALDPSHQPKYTKPALAAFGLRHPCRFNVKSSDGSSNHPTPTGIAPAEAHPPLSQSSVPTSRAAERSIPRLLVRRELAGRLPT